MVLSEILPFVNLTSPDNLDGSPAEQSSRTNTWCPWLASRLLSATPMNPAPPVIKNFMVLNLQTKIIARKSSIT
jgi:hypothetical protein